jgi:hypothetical protein
MPLWLHHKIDQKNIDHKIGKKEKKRKEKKKRKTCLNVEKLSIMYFIKLMSISLINCD